MKSPTWKASLGDHTAIVIGRADLQIVDKDPGFRQFGFRDLNFGFGVGESSAVASTILAVLAETSALAVSMAALAAFSASRAASRSLTVLIDEFFFDRPQLVEILDPLVLNLPEGQVGLLTFEVRLFFVDVRFCRLQIGLSTVDRRLGQTDLCLGLVELSLGLLDRLHEFRGKDLRQQLARLDGVADVDVLNFEKSRDLGVEIGIIKRFDRARLCDRADHPTHARSNHVDPGHRPW